jgi:hypothetical protein
MLADWPRPGSHLIGLRVDWSGSPQALAEPEPGLGNAQTSVNREKATRRPPASRRTRGSYTVRDVKDTEEGKGRNFLCCSLTCR